MENRSVANLIKENINVMYADNLTLYSFAMVQVPFGLIFPSYIWLYPAVKTLCGGHFSQLDALLIG
jgi:hypothetical protein